MIGIRYLSTSGIVLPSVKPKSGRSTPHANAPRIVYPRNARYVIFPAPANRGVIVRMIGKKREKNIAFVPYVLKNTSVRARYSGLKKRERSLENIFGPKDFPVAYPAIFPMIAQKNMIDVRSVMSKYPCDARNPAVKRRLSPGKTSPIKSPHSAKIIKAMPM